MRRTLGPASRILTAGLASQRTVTNQALHALYRNISTDVQKEVYKWDPTIAVESATTPPSSWFTDPRIYQLEKEAVFGSSWVCVGRRDQLQGLGSFFSGTLAGEPYVVVRDHGGTVRAFFNVCRHHAAQLTPLHGEGTLDKFVCPYHGWTYSLEGRLTKALRLKGIKEFKAKDFGLKQIAAETFGPLVFINLNRHAETKELKDNFLEVFNRLEERQFSGMSWVRRVEYPMQCNWKVFVDNYLDGGYHVEHLHPTLTDTLDISSYQAMVTPLYSIQEVEGVGDARVGAHALYIYLYPSLMINRYGPWMDTNMVIPTSHSTCTVVYDYFLQKDTLESLGEDKENFLATSLAASDQVQQEDNMICESVQRGLQSSAYDTGRYAPGVEHADHAFHQTLALQLRGVLGQE